MRQLFFRSVMETNGDKVMTFAVFVINTLLSLFLARILFFSSRLARSYFLADLGLKFI